ncbi:unnamed protein product [Psylliodes chrysocephalus]|uniref:Uncharacterized protein n=1 Tax=Psylliodes chrysocephalus TaxID=3402493 RepID=A0A9P0G4N3_9CUCU|nr:unnamed protein product [Psylliodes chrysocephala]
MKVQNSKKRRKSIVHRDSSSDSDKEMEVMTINTDSDVDPELLFDLENTNENDKNSLNVATDASFTHDLTADDFIIVQMATKNGTSRKYVTKILTRENQSTFFCHFLWESKVKDAYVFPTAEDKGIVNMSEIIKKLTEPKVLRQGQLQFKNM